MSGKGELLVLPDAAAVAQALADAFVEGAQQAIEEHGAFFVALSGGSTPKAAYELLAQSRRSEAVPWSSVFVYFGDERCVPPDNDRSNYKMAQAAFLHAVPIPAENVRRMRGEDPPADAARAYAHLLVESMGDIPRFDLLLLGMGPDGHTASLFPGTDPMTDADRLVRAPFVEKMNGYRLTVTPPVINNAHQVVIATEGTEKAKALAAVREGPYDPVRHPIQIVDPRSGRLTWLVDRAAASLLNTQ